MRILISGNCLGGPLETAAREAGRILQLPLDVLYVRNFVGKTDQELGEDIVAFAQKADFFVQQVGLTMADPVADIVTKNAKVFRYPAVRLNFLWPFATRPHPLSLWNEPYNGNGIFNVYLSDSLLAGLMDEDPDPESVFERFMRIDPLNHANLDRLFEVTRQQFKRNEAECDIGMWDDIETRFRSERLFWDAGHPTWTCFWPVVEAMLQFLDIGVDAAVTKALRSRLDPGFLLRNHDAPIHPRVAEHFGLSWWRPELRYRLDHDGWFTYDEWVRRFIGFRHDLRCYSGHWHTFKSGGDRARGEADLRGALADAPGNAQAR